MITIEQAFELISSIVKPHCVETISFENSVGRVLAEPIFADVDSPPHTKSVMDGFAVRSTEVSRDGRFKVLETIVAGDVPTVDLAEGTCSRIMTGAPLPNGADAVVMVEQSEMIESSENNLVKFDLDNLEPGRHTMRKASSFAVGEKIFDSQHLIRALDIGLIAEVGAHQLQVYRKATASVLPTGNELVDAATKPAAGQIRNSNGPMLISLLKNAGVDATHLGIGRDDRMELSEKIKQGLQSDFLILSGGVSAGTMDLVPELLLAAGVKQVFHKVMVKPGKPIWFGVLEKSSEKKYVFGLPGNPVSSLVGFELFVRAAIRRLNGHQQIRPNLIAAPLAAPHEARGNRPTYWPGKWLENDQVERSIVPLKWMGSSDLRALGKADSLIFFPSDKDHFDAGETVQVISLC